MSRERMLSSRSKSKAGSNSLSAYTLTNRHTHSHTLSKYISICWLYIGNYVISMGLGGLGGCGTRSLGNAIPKNRTLLGLSRRCEQSRKQRSSYMSHVCVCVCVRDAASPCVCVFVRDSASQCVCVWMWHFVVAVAILYINHKQRERAVAASVAVAVAAAAECLAAADAVVVVVVCVCRHLEFFEIGVRYNKRNS